MPIDYTVPAKCEGCKKDYRLLDGYTEIIVEDRKPGQPAYNRRLLLLCPACGIDFRLIIDGH